MQIRTNKSNNYLPEDLVEYLKRNNESINQAVISEINTLKRIRTVALGELKGIFTPQEWIFFADVFNSVRVEDFFRTNVGVLIATCEDAERFENTATNHRVDMPILIAYKKLLDMYNEDNCNYPSAPNWGVAVHQNRGACATFTDGTRSYKCDSRTYEIVELPDRIADLLKEEVGLCADIEVYGYKGVNHSIHTDCIVSLDDEMNFNELYCAGINEFDFEVMDEDDYNNTVLANSCISADFEELYGDKNAKVLIIVLKNYIG
ncbi:hypothetical protein [Phocaeicola plebeius]|uniref:hypothetical protein n=1 Tax=Phocaeicola plebeius TaxID=310297 RepID=UPI0026EC2EE4|nr:hypothetical protein [Phocaeicola plebeius]